MIDLQTLPIILTGVGMMIALSYYALTLRNQNRTRQAQLLMGLYETYRSPEFRKRQTEILFLEWKDFDDFQEKYMWGANPDVWVNWLSLGGFFNGIGVLLRRKLIEIDLVEELLSNITFVVMERMRPILMGWRATSRFPASRSKKYELMSGFEYLYNELKRREERHPEIKT